MMRACNPALGLCSAVYHTPGSLSVPELLLLTEKHARGIPPLPRCCELAPSQAALKRSITQTQHEGRRLPPPWKNVPKSYISAELTRPREGSPTCL